jgi:hypothetical protein
MNHESASHERTSMRAASLRTRLTWLIIAVQVGVLIPLGVLSYQRELAKWITCWTDAWRRLAARWDH